MRPEVSPLAHSGRKSEARRSRTLTRRCCVGDAVSSSETLSYRDVAELLAERGVAVGHVTIYRWVHAFTPEFIDVARHSRSAAGDRWFIDETYVQVTGRWTYLYRAVDQPGQVIDVLLSERRDGVAARAFFTCAMRFGSAPSEVTTDRAPVYPRVIDDLALAHGTLRSDTPTTRSRLSKGWTNSA